MEHICTIGNSVGAIGKEVAIRNRLGGFQFGYEVLRVTPIGQVVVKRISDGYTRKFDKRGREMHRGGYGDELEFNVEGAREQVEGISKRRVAANLLNEVNLQGPVKYTWAKESMERIAAELQEKLDAAKAAIAAL
jgi:hypothetical protein